MIQQRTYRHDYLSSSIELKWRLTRKWQHRCLFEAHFLRLSQLARARGCHKAPYLQSAIGNRFLWLVFKIHLPSRDFLDPRATVIEL